MQITRLEAEKGGKVRIWLNDEPAFWLYEDEVKTLGLSAGDVLDEEAVGQIEDRLCAKHAVQRSMDILGRQDKTRRQLIDKLKDEGYSVRIAEMAAEEMLRQHFLDDVRYAAMYMEGRKDRKNFRVLSMELKGKGISDADLEAALLQVEFPGPELLIRQMALKKKIDPETASGEQLQRFYQMMMRKGFSYGEIKQALTAKQ